MKNIRKRALSLIISLVLCLLTVSAAAPTKEASAAVLKKEASAASTYIKVDAFIKYVAQKLNLQIDKNSQTPYIDAAMNAGILKKGDFKSYTAYLTRTDCAVIANRVDEYINGEHFGYSDEVYEFLKDCEYLEGKLYYNMEAPLYPEGETYLTYKPAQFLNDVVLPRLSGFKFDKELRGRYYEDRDNNGTTLGEYIQLGLINSSAMFVDPFKENDYLIQAWQKIVDGERKIAAVYDKRISDFNKITKSKRQDVAEVVAKGIIKGYSNGMYVQNRSFKGSGKITVSGAKSVIIVTIDKNARSSISPDGQLIRTTKLPKNASEFPYILECFPNKFYEMVYSFQRDKPYIEGTMDREKYLYPVETGNAELLKAFKEYLAVDIKPYEYYDVILKKASQYLNCVFNVDYRTVGQEWIDRVARTYSPMMGTHVYDRINKYVKAMKNNHVVVESEIISLETSTMYKYYSDYYVRVYVRYRITADTVKVEDDYVLLLGSIFGTYLVGLKGGEWTYGYYDIELSGSNLNDVSRIEFGMSPSVGITDEPLKGSK